MNEHYCIGLGILYTCTLNVDPDPSHLRQKAQMREQYINIKTLKLAKNDNHKEVLTTRHVVLIFTNISYRLKVIN